MRRFFPALFPFVALGVPLALATGACGSDDDLPAVVPDGDAGTDGAPLDSAVNACGAGQALCGSACAAVSNDDDRCGAGSCAVACTGGKHCLSGTCTASKIAHVVVIVQENHTFDSYFGKYCQAPAGSAPTCTAGRACCEGAPAKEPHGASPGVLDDNPNNATSNFKTDRDHDQACELQQIHGGAMDQFVTGSTGGSTCLGVGPKCAAAANWVLATGERPGDPVYDYWQMASQGALADRYFQPIAGGTSSNDMYLAGAHFRFVDNQQIPKVATGTSPTKADRLCTLETSPAACVDNGSATFPQETVAGLLLDAGKSFRVYADGFDEAYAARSAPSPTCVDPGTIAECPYNNCSAFGGHPVACHACVFDPSDIPFLYFKRFADQPGGNGGFTPTPYVDDYTAFRTDIAAGTLPEFAFVKARSFRNEHPNVSTIADGVAFVKATVEAVEQSPYKDNTLVLLTWDEGGGFYDHVAPPKAWPTSVDADDSGAPVPYGTRIPMIAIGPFAKPGTVSHVTLDHASVVKFLEWNFLTKTGQLQARDTVVNNLGSLLDATKTGLPVPEN